MIEFSVSEAFRELTKSNSHQGDIFDFIEGLKFLMFNFLVVTILAYFVTVGVVYNPLKIFDFN